MLSFSITIITFFFIYKMFDFYLQNLQGLCLCRLCCGSKSGWQLISWMAMVVMAVAVLEFGRVLWVNSSGQHLKCMVFGNVYSWYDDNDLRKELMRCEIYEVWGWVYELLKSWWLWSWWQRWKWWWWSRKGSASLWDWPHICQNLFSWKWIHSEGFPQLLKLGWKRGSGQDCIARSPLCNAETGDLDHNSYCTLG